jgi:hypothetical protein
MKKTIQLRYPILILLVFGCAFSRLIPHMHNFSPLGAMALFGAAYFAQKWQGILIPLLATWVSDLLINNVIYARYYPEFTWFYSGFYWQYGSYILISVAGFFILRKVTSTTVLAGALSATTLFFLISNFGCWVANPMYNQSFYGLLSCYAAGLPFLKGTLLGDLIYSGVLFGSFALMQSRIPALRLKHAQAN